MPDRLDRVLTRRRDRRDDAGEDPDGDADAEAEEDRPERDHRLQGQPALDHRADDHGQADPERAAADGETHGFREELVEDVAAAGADGLPDADLARPLRDGDE